jgi:hypothetical protein
LLPLDTFVDRPVTRMEVVDDPSSVPEVQRDFVSMASRIEGRELGMASLPRFEFYDRVRGAFAVVVTSEARLTVVSCSRSASFDLPGLRGSSRTSVASRLGAPASIETIISTIDGAGPPRLTLVPPTCSLILNPDRTRKGISRMDALDAQRGPKRRAQPPAIGCRAKESVARRVGATAHPRTKPSKATAVSDTGRRLTRALTGPTHPHR